MGQCLEVGHSYSQIKSGSEKKYKVYQLCPGHRHVWSVYTGERKCMALSVGISKSVLSMNVSYVLHKLDISSVCLDAKMGLPPHLGVSDHYYLQGLCLKHMRMSLCSALADQ